MSNGCLLLTHECYLPLISPHCIDDTERSLVQDVYNHDPYCLEHCQRQSEEGSVEYQVLLYGFMFESKVASPYLWECEKHIIAGSPISRAFYALYCFSLYWLRKLYHSATEISSTFHNYFFFNKKVSWFVYLKWVTLS